MKFAILACLLLVAVPASAQPAGQQTIFATIDKVSGQDASGPIVLKDGQPAIFEGWAFNGTTRQQPTDCPGGASVQLTFIWFDETGGHPVTLTSKDGLAVYWRKPRPDVSRQFGYTFGASLLPDHVGVEIRTTLPLPKGGAYYLLYLMDPCFGYGEAHQLFYLVVQ